MRACSGVWIAHGSGSADREVVDAHDRVGVPADRPAYQIRRVWLTPEQEKGYYYGFANEGLWPLCHIAHVRPIFRTSDWERYREVNRLFAKTVVEEAASSDPIVLVQDYHFALLPRMIREALPNATIVTFWHIPWPNPEAFAICPWREELLDGLLGSSILGFHTQFHCNNFVDTVDRTLEARVDRETFNVSYRGTLTAVKRYPISIEWPLSPELTATPVDECRREVRQRHGLPATHAIGVGIDRLDYTKGIEERLRAVERLLEVHPEWIGRFTFIQVAAPTRGRIEEYQHYEARIRALVESISARFAGNTPPPILLLVAHHEPDKVYQYYRAADLCFVSSLHDGMNLVAKEFVASRDDERGVLVLSRFTGAARELPEALIVNPYDTDQCANALAVALAMPVGEQRARMRLMRGLIEEYNVFRWTGRMLIDAAGMRSRHWLSKRSSVPDLLNRPTHRVQRVRSPIALPAPDPSWAYFLDIDGTLLGFASTPDGVRAGRGLLEDIASLSVVTQGALALITGRSIKDVDRLFPSARFAVAGQHGLERRSTAGRVVHHPVSRRKLGGVRQRLTDAVTAHPGLLLEDKGSSLALHYRKRPALAGYAHRLARAEIARLGPGFGLRAGKQVVEIAPIGRDKGVAIRDFMKERPFRGRVPVFLGDDVTDEAGFRMVNRLGGYSIKVGRGATDALWRVRDVAAVRSWLRQVLTPFRRAS